ncbi:MAG: porin [bacterium]|nr:porin [bacterium]
MKKTFTKNLKINQKKKQALKLFLLFLTILCNPNRGISQINTDLPSKQPIFSFTNGIGILAPDSSFSLNMRFRFQSRFLMFTNSTSDFSPSAWEARVRRTRLSFLGHLYNPKLTYYLQLSFSRGDMDWSATDVSNINTSPNVVRDAMIFYKPNKNLQLGFGQGKLPGNR